MLDSRAVALDRRDPVDHIEPRGDPAEDRVLAVEPGAGGGGDDEWQCAGGAGR